MKPFYRIISFSPPSEPRPGMYGFGVLLNREFAVKAKSTKRDEDIIQRLQDRGSEIIKRVWEHNTEFGGDFSGYRPYNFVDDSLLLQYCHVPGNACDLGLDPGRIRTLDEDYEFSKEGNIEYGPHNVDGFLQAYNLLSVWLEWASAADLILNQEH